MATSKLVNKLRLLRLRSVVVRGLSILALVLFTFSTYAQRNVWRDDKEAVLKADTSLVKIGNSYYQKLITVTYKEVTSDTFDEKIEELKRRKDELKARFDGEREQYQKQLEQLNEQLEAERVFVQATKQEMKWLDREEKEKVNPKRSESEVQEARREEFFKSKPKKDGGKD
jgi:hypothetical protein